jgi:ubiquinone/menaquinone biosynthesis C-methylase UbiE
MQPDVAVPSYEPMLAAYHRAFAPELRAMVGTLPIATGQTVLDMACGDGVYSPWLAERVGSTGRVVSVDLMPEYLDLARKETAKSILAGMIEFSAASIELLPFKDDTFDLCWCAQSLYSLPDPVDSLRHMLRVTKPDGVVAVLEEDTLHNVILPWPIEVELSMRVAELQALTNTSDKPRKFYVGRQLRRVFRTAGLERIQTRTFASDRVSPLGPNERTFLTEYLKRLSERIAMYFDGPIRAEFDRLVNPDSSGFMLDDPDLTTTCIDYVVWGRKPSDVHRNL